MMWAWIVVAVIMFAAQWWGLFVLRAQLMVESNDKAAMGLEIRNLRERIGKFQSSQSESASWVSSHIDSISRRLHHVESWTNGMLRRQELTETALRDVSDAAIQIQSAVEGVFLSSSDFCSGV